MKTALSLVAGLVFAGLGASPAWAQYYPPYGGSYHAATAEESMANGMANVISSAGQANLLNSAAARNYEEARSRDLDNRLKAENTYFEMRKMNREYVAAERGPKPTSEQMFRYAKERAPNRLNPNQLDPLTGQISWPVVLEDDTYKAHRDKLDELFASRAKYHGQLGPQQYNEILKTTKALDAELKKHIREVPPGDYTKAKSLIESLGYEASLSAG
jgi:hypothetical protein